MAYQQGTRGGAKLPTDDKPTPPLVGNTDGPGNQNQTTRTPLNRDNITSDPSYTFPTGRR